MITIQQITENHTIVLSRVFLISLPVPGQSRLTSSKCTRGPKNRSWQGTYSNWNLTTSSQNRPLVIIRSQSVQCPHQLCLENLPFPRRAQPHSSPDSGKHPGEVLEAILDPMGEMTVDAYHNRHDLNAKVVNQKTRKTTVNQWNSLSWPIKPLTMTKYKLIHSETIRNSYRLTHQGCTRKWCSVSIEWKPLEGKWWWLRIQTVNALLRAKRWCWAYSLRWKPIPH